jgi:multidrug resistance efflux pump
MSLRKENNFLLLLSRHFRWMRIKVLPFLVWIIAVIGALYLARNQNIQVDATGVVEIYEVAVSPLIDGKVQGLFVDLFDDVEKGQKIALMDDSLIRAELIVAESELGMIKSGIESARAAISQDSESIELDRENDLRRFYLNEEEARIDLLDRIVRQETDKIELQRLTVLLIREKKLIEEKVSDQASFDDINLRHESLKKNLKENEKAIYLAGKNLEKCGERLKKRLAITQDKHEDSILAPLRDNIKVQQAKISEIMERRRTLVIRAPLSGKISQIIHKPGKTVLAGDPILTITDPKSSRILAYVNESMLDKVKVGEKVTVYSVSRPEQITEAKVLKISSRIEVLPPRLQRSPMFTEWGLAVLVGDIPEDLFIPGEAISLSFFTVSRR